MKNLFKGLKSEVSEATEEVVKLTTIEKYMPAIKVGLAVVGVVAAKRYIDKKIQKEIDEVYYYNDIEKDEVNDFDIFEEYDK